MSYGIDFFEDFPPELFPFIPNVQFNPRTFSSSYFGPSFTKKVVARSVLFIATRTIENEELFLDYSFQGKTLPEWYK
jgi:hypothetical protein